MKRVSIIVGTHERKKALIKLLKSFNNLDYSKKYYEVIIVDSSLKKLDKKYHKFCDKYIHKPDIKEVSKKKNIGIKKAKGEILIFTDDDTKVDKNWIKSYLSCFNNTDSGVCTGKVINLPRDAEFNKYYKYNLGDKEKTFYPKLIIFPWKIGHGNNFAFKKQVFDKIGLFDKNFGPGSKALPDDSDLIYRALRAGFSITYCPKALVYHYIGERNIKKDAYIYGWGGYSFFKKYPIGFLIPYIVSIISLIRKIILSDRDKRKIWITSLKGWLGFKK